MLSYTACCLIIAGLPLPSLPVHADTLHIAIQTEGVFRPVGASMDTANPDVTFLATNSFEDVDLSQAGKGAVYNLGVFSGVPAGATNHHFTLTLRQSVNSGPAVVVGAWSATLHGDTVDFQPRLLRYTDGERVYLWVLEQHRYQLKEGWAPVNATLFVLDYKHGDVHQPAKFSAGPPKRYREQRDCGD